MTSLWYGPTRIRSKKWAALQCFETFSKKFCLVLIIFDYVFFFRLERMNGRKMDKVNFFAGSESDSAFGRKNNKVLIYDNIHKNSLLLRVTYQDIMSSYVAVSAKRKLNDFTTVFINNNNDCTEKPFK